MNNNENNTVTNNQNVFNYAAEEVEFHHFNEDISVTKAIKMTIDDNEGMDNVLGSYLEKNRNIGRRMLVSLLKDWMNTYKIAGWKADTEQKEIVTTAGEVL